ncbi:MAG: protein translocase subunit SecF [Deltaproteobacteria bacterium]|nr:MAG: protein translocase subunit SecF [Deltaproteobacteria bacterium]
MASTHKPFRELIPPGTNFEFVGKTRLWVTISVLAIAASIGMLFVNKSTRGSILNWAIDFRGGTEIIFRFTDKGAGAEAKAAGADGRKVDPGVIRDALTKAGFDGVEVSDYVWTVPGPNGERVTVEGLRVRTPDFGAIDEDKQAGYAEQFVAKFETDQRKILKVSWSGDTMFVRSTAPFDEAEVAAFFQSIGLEMKPWGEAAADFATAEEGTGEYNARFAIWGVDRQYELAIEKALPDIDATVVQVYGVGAKAGAQLRNDGIKSLFYAMLLIMLYLVVRFDVRYAPGAVVALLHDAMLVVGAFAVTWTDVSLTTVAALLTVIGYSVNDTVVIFDRIRENASRLKDKKFPRVINISLNETLSRTLLTSLTVFVVTLMMNVFGTGLVRDFAFAMNVGVVVGTYSSIFIASPIVLLIHNKYFSAPAAKKAR